MCIDIYVCVCRRHQVDGSERGKEEVEAEMEHFHFLLANCENHGSLNPQNDIAKQKWGKKRREEKKKIKEQKVLSVRVYVCA